jgi:uncharacterized protein YqhQ
VKPLVGGQALVEGVMMRGPKITAAAARTPKGRIVHTTFKNAAPSLKVPVVRGVVYLWDHLKLGFAALTWSANQQGEEELSGGHLALTFGISLLVAIGLFILAPYYLSRLFFPANTFAFNLIDGVFRLLIFLAYLIGISFMPDVRRMFEYHGAEHKAVHCFEADKSLTVKNVQRYPTEHPRCGTSLIVFVIAISIVIFSIIRFNAWYWNVLARLLALPVIAGISYEALKLTARLSTNKFLAWLTLPGIWLQKITTQQPDNKQVEVAIEALKRAVK